MLRVCVFLVITATLWGLYSTQSSHNFKVKLLQATVEKCSGDYFDCDETELLASDYNDTLATGNGMIKIMKDIPSDMNISMKVLAQQVTNDYSVIFDHTLALCDYFVQYSVFCGILTEFWERQEDNEKPQKCPITAGSYIVIDSWINETRLPSDIPANLEMYRVSLQLDYLDTQMLLFENDDDGDLAITADEVNTIDMITKQTMVDPVRVEQCGHSFERTSILALLKRKPYIRVLGYNIRCYLLMISWWKTDELPRCKNRDIEQIPGNTPEHFEYDFKVRLLATTKTACKGEYFDCDETDLVTADYNDTMATGNGLIKIIKDVPQDMNISLKVEAQQSNNDYSIVFDKNMTLCGYFQEYPQFSGIIADFWEEEESKASPKECPIPAGSYVVTDSWVNETRLPSTIPYNVEQYKVSMRFDYTEPELLGFIFQVQIVR